MFLKGGLLIFIIAIPYYGMVIVNVEECELAKHAPYKNTPFFDEQGHLRYRLPLFWAILGPMEQ